MAKTARNKSLGLAKGLTKTDLLNVIDHLHTTLAAERAKPPLQEIVDWLINTIKDLTVTRPVTESRVISTLMLDVNKLEILITLRYFPGRPRYKVNVAYQVKTVAFDIREQI